MMYVLDGHLVSELRKAGSGKADANLASWADGVDAPDLFVRAITIMEVELGVRSIERRDTSQGALLRSWLKQQVLPEFSERILPVDTAVVQRRVRLQVPDRPGERDRLIAAKALVHGMAIGIRNVVPGILLFRNPTHIRAWYGDTITSPTSVPARR